MPKIFNTFAEDDTLTKAIRNLGSATFGGNQAQQELIRQRALSARTSNENLPLLAEALVARDLDNSIRAGVLSGQDPKSVAGFGQFRDVNRFGPESRQALTSTLAVPGSNFGNTIQGTREDFANRRAIENLRTQRQFDAERLKVDNQPVVVVDPASPLGIRTISASEALRTGAPIVQDQSKVKGALTATNFNNLEALNPSQREIIGANVPLGDVLNAQTASGALAPARSAPSGVGFVNAQTGQPITEPILSVGKLTAQTAGGLSDPTAARQRNEAEIAVTQLSTSIDRAIDNLKKPNAGAVVGPLGAAARAINTVRSQVEAGAKLIGGTTLAEDVAAPEVGSSLTEATLSLSRQLGTDAAIVRSQLQDLAFLIAKSNDPGGRISVDDVRRSAEIIGASSGDPTATIAVLEDVKARAIENFDIRQRVTGRSFPGLARQAQPSAGTNQPNPGSPAGVRQQDPLAAPRTRIRIDAEGNVLQ